MAHLLDVNRAAVLQTYAMDEQRVAESLKTLRDWLRTQPHLPPIDDVRLEKCLVNSKFRLEVTKRLVDGYYTVRTQFPEFFADRDPFHPDIQRVFTTFAVVMLKPLTKTLERVMVLKLLDGDVDSLNVVHLARCCLMIEDLRSRYDFERAMHFVWDFSSATFAHHAKISLDAITKCLKIFVNGYKIRLVAIHIVNPPPFVPGFITLMKIITPSHLFKKIMVHSTLESFHEHIPKEILPCDLGGELKSTQELFGEWISALEENRDWFLAEQKVRVDESLRPKELQNDLFGSIHGSFRSLAID